MSAPGGRRLGSGGAAWQQGTEKSRQVWSLKPRMVEEAEEWEERRGVVLGEEEEAGTEGFTRASAAFCPPFPSLFLIQFYHKTSTYCINNRIPKPLIINRISKYNRWSAY